MSPKRAVSALAGSSLLLVSAWMSYDNVFSDLAPIQAEAEKAACTVKKCSEQHGVTSGSRTPIGQTFAFTWRDGTVSVECHRTAWVVGARTCTVTQ